MNRNTDTLLQALFSCIVYAKNDILEELDIPAKLLQNQLIIQYLTRYPSTLERDMSTLGVHLDRIERLRIEDIVKKVKATLHDEISFCGNPGSYCMGIVDMVNSTKITACMESPQMCEYYRIYLNAMAEIAKEFGAVVVKNIGDSILYYFPGTCDAEDKASVQNSLECSLAMVESYEEINILMTECGLPPVSYRVSSDYGRLTIAKSLFSTREDIFGPTVNTCAKINGIAMPNSTVVGGDLYQIARQFKGYGFHSLVGFSVGVRLDYPVYSLCRKDVT